MSASYHPVCFICGADRADGAARCKRCNGSTIVNVARRAAVDAPPATDPRSPILPTPPPAQEPAQ